MSDGAKLREDHAQLVKLLRSLSVFIQESSPPQPLELFELRRQLSATLISHLKAEDWVLYPRLLASSDDAIAETARTFNEEMGGLAAAFMAYSDKWNATAIAQDWAAYCADSRTIIDAPTDRITRENRELLPLLDRLDEAA